MARLTCTSKKQLRRIVLLGLHSPARLKLRIDPDQHLVQSAQAPTRRGYHDTLLLVIVHLDFALDDMRSNKCALM